MVNHIALRGVGKTYAWGEERFTALDTINLTFSHGEHVAILGKSGSGKSTLLNILTGIDRPSRGEVVADGVHLEALSETKLARWRGRNVGIVFQFYQLVPTLTIRENVLLAMEFANVTPKGAREQRVRSLLETLGIAAQLNKLPTAMSGGEQQRAAIARALANDPSMIVADEPTGNLDSKTAADVLQLLRQISHSGKMVIVVTHDEAAANQFSRIIRLKDGRVESDRGLSDVVRSPGQ